MQKKALVENLRTKRAFRRSRHATMKRASSRRCPPYTHRKYASSGQPQAELTCKLYQKRTGRLNGHNPNHVDFVKCTRLRVSAERLPAPKAKARSVHQCNDPVGSARFERRAIGAVSARLLKKGRNNTLMVQHRSDSRVAALRAPFPQPAAIRRAAASSRINA